MARIQYNKADLIADWKTGKFTERALASKHRVSPATAHNLVAGIEKSIEPLISKQVEINQELVNLNEQEVSKFKQEVDSRTRNLACIDSATMKNVSILAKKIDLTLTVKDHRDAQATFKDARETIAPKVETAIQINNTQSSNLTLPEYKQALREALDAI